MNDPTEALRSLVTRAHVLSLATMDGGAPALSLVPYAVAFGPARLYVLLSELAAHTAALRADARCGWMIHEPVRGDDPRGGHGLARVTARATARFLSRDEAREAGAEGLYRGRFAVADTLLGLRDFHFCELAPTAGTVAFVQGFGRAYRVTGDDFEGVEHVTGR
jgi:putative heme iron utilization protein